MEFRPVDLVRIDPSRRMRRFYRLVISETLWGEICLIREWGRIGSPGRILREIFPDSEEAGAEAFRIAGVKLRRGYVQIAGPPLPARRINSRASSASKR